MKTGLQVGGGELMLEAGKKLEVTNGSRKELE